MPHHAETLVAQFGGDAGLTGARLGPGAGSESGEKFTPPSHPMQGSPCLAPQKDRHLPPKVTVFRRKMPLCNSSLRTPRFSNQPVLEILPLRERAISMTSRFRSEGLSRA